MPEVLPGSAPTIANTPEEVAATDDAIVVDRLVKVYGERRAVDELSFRVHRGEIFALLGPNGAGKTTTVEILEGYRDADDGQVEVLGLSPRRDEAELKQQIGVMLQHAGIYPKVSAREILDLFRRFYDDPEDPNELLDLVGLQESADTRYKQLSGGQQRRLALAAALIGKPSLLFLDEPTTAMDPQARRLTWEIIEGLRERGLTVLLTTHFMEEAERLADRVAIIDHGRLLTLDTPRRLTHARSQEIQFSGPPELELSEFSSLPSVSTCSEPQPGFYVLETADPIDGLAEITAWGRQHRILLNDLRIGHESLEDVFLRLTGRELRE